MSTVDGALLLSIAILLPFRLIPLPSKFFPCLDLIHSRGSASPLTATARSVARSVALFVSIGLVLTAVFDMSHGWSSDQAALVAEVQQLKVKTAQLDLILRESQDTLYSKTLHLAEKDKIVAEMEQKIQNLQNDLHEIKDASSNLLLTEKRISALEEEVQYLSDLSRKNIENVNILESLADDAKEKLDSSTSEVEKMESIVTEQWILIQQLEQAFQVTKIRAAKLLKRNSHNSHNGGRTPGKPIRTMVRQFFESISRKKVSKTVNTPDSFFLGALPWAFISELQNSFKMLMSLFQNIHYELQELVRTSLKMNKFTASVSNEMVISILACAIMAIPVFSGWMVLLFLSDEEEDDDCD